MPLIVLCLLFLLSPWNWITSRGRWTQIYSNGKEIMLLQPWPFFSDGKQNATQVRLKQNKFTTLITVNCMVDHAWVEKRISVKPWCSPSLFAMIKMYFVFVVILVSLQLSSCPLFALKSASQTCYDGWLVLIYSVFLFISIFHRFICLNNPSMVVSQRWHVVNTANPTR